MPLQNKNAVRQNTRRRLYIPTTVVPPLLITHGAIYDDTASIR